MTAQLMAKAKGKNMVNDIRFFGFSMLPLTIKIIGFNKLREAKDAKHSQNVPKPDDEGDPPFKETELNQDD